MEMYDDALPAWLLSTADDAADADAACTLPPALLLDELETLLADHDLSALADPPQPLAAAPPIAAAPPAPSPPSPPPPAQPAPGGKAKPRRAAARRSRPYAVAKHVPSTVMPSAAKSHSQAAELPAPAAATAAADAAMPTVLSACLNPADGSLSVLPLPPQSDRTAAAASQQRPAKAQAQPQPSKAAAPPKLPASVDEFLASLTAEERRLMEAEGAEVPLHGPLSKQAEKELKKLRRKIKNKLSAKDSRQRQKQYLTQLEAENKRLRQQLAMANASSGSNAQTATGNRKSAAALAASAPTPAPSPAMTLSQAVAVIQAAAAQAVATQAPPPTSSEPSPSSAASSPLSQSDDSAPLSPDSTISTMSDSEASENSHTSNVPSLHSSKPAASAARPQRTSTNASNQCCKHNSKAHPSALATQGGKACAVMMLVLALTTTMSQNGDEDPVSALQQMSRDSGANLSPSLVWVQHGDDDAATQPAGGMAMKPLSDDSFPEGRPAKAAKLSARASRHAEPLPRSGAAIKLENDAVLSPPYSAGGHVAFDAAASPVLHRLPVDQESMIVDSLHRSGVLGLDARDQRQGLQSQLWTVLSVNSARTRGSPAIGTMTGADTIVSAR